jgi:hypothetical protein
MIELAGQWNPQVASGGDTIIGVMGLLVVLALLLSAVPTMRVAQERQAVVDRFYPQQRTTSRPDGRHTCFMVRRLTSSNEPDAIATSRLDASQPRERIHRYAALPGHVETATRRRSSSSTTVKCASSAVSTR